MPVDSDGDWTRDGPLDFTFLTDSCLGDNTVGVGDLIMVLTDFE